MNCARNEVNETGVNEKKYDKWLRGFGGGTYLAKKKLIFGTRATTGRRRHICAPTFSYLMLTTDCLMIQQNILLPRLHPPGHPVWWASAVWASPGPRHQQALRETLAHYLSAKLYQPTLVKLIHNMYHLSMKRKRTSKHCNVLFISTFSSVMLRARFIIAFSIMLSFFIYFTNKEIRKHASDVWQQMKHCLVF